MSTTPQSLLFHSYSSPPSAIELAQERRRELTDLFQGEKRYFLRIANLILQNEADAEDAIHNSFCAAWKAIAAFRGDSAMKTWFSRIVTNHAITLLGTRKTGRLLYIEENPEYVQAIEQSSGFEVEDPEMIAVRRELLRIVTRHVRQLPTETRIVFRLHFYDDHSVAEIAEMRGKSALAITAHLQRGKAILRRRVRKVPAHRIAFKRKQVISA